MVIIPSVNLALHRVISNCATPSNCYDVSQQFLYELAESLEKLIKTSDSLASVTLYFDDNHLSTLEIAEPTLRRFAVGKAISVPSDTIGMHGHCSTKELKMLSSHGFSILPHGTSHAALAIYKGDVLQNTPSGGCYQNMPFGKDFVLTEAEVRYQLMESKMALAEFCPSEFVLPYGLYNSDTIAINDQHKFYLNLTTCEPHLDFGNSLRPRLLVTNDQSIEELLSRITNLRPLEGS